MAPFTSASLYVGDLHPEVTETLLFEIFKQVGAVASIRVCRDAVTRRSLGYAYVNFHTVSDAEHALEILNFSLIKNRPCRIMWSYRDPSIRKSGLGNVFIKNLHKSIDNKALSDTFGAFGNILSCKVVTDENGVSRGYGFVHYERQEEAEQAIAKVNNMLLAGKQVYVGPFIPKKEKLKSGEYTEKFTNVYVKNLDASVDENELQQIFSKYGTITGAVIMRENGVSKGFGFVNFSHPDQAKEAVTEMSGKEINGKILYAGKAQKKSEREAELRHKFEQLRLERLNKYQGVNLYIKNLDDTIDDERMKLEFVPYGNITSAKVMRDEKGNSKGFGFVCFSTPEEATKAVTEMNGRIFGTKPLYVALAQRREVRRAQLEAQHRQAQANLAAARAGLGNPLYSAPAATGGAPVFYPPGAPLPPNTRGQNFMYPQQMIPRTRWPGSQNQQNNRPGAYQGMPNYGVPVPQRSRPSRQRGSQTQVVGGSGNGRGQGGQGGQGVQNGAKRGFKYTPNARNPPQSGMPILQQSPNMPSQPLGPDSGSQISALVAAPPEERKQLLGETLFPLIAVHEPHNAGKITGMLLESLDWSELIHLIESTDTLLAKIVEAREVLQTHAEQEVDQEQTAQ